MELLKPLLLFDWGDTLMRDFPGLPAPMANWSHVETMPGVAETLARLQPDWRMVVASNADVSKEADIRLALRRVDLESWFEAVFCFENVGRLKPDPEFFDRILAEVQGQASQALMVGDNFEADVLGANGAGLRSVWYNWKTPDEHTTDLHCTIHQFDQLPDAIHRLLAPG